MRKNLLVIFLLLAGTAIQAQTGFVFSCTRDTVVNCTESCITLHGYIPNLHSLSDDYDVSPGTGSFCTVQVPSSTAQGTPTNITLDDRYTQVIPLPFDFPFYGIYFSQLVASSNGYVSFDDTRANTFSHYAILNGGGFLTAGGTNPGQDLPSTLYDRALIMGPYHDIDISQTNSPNRKIYYQVDGVAPYRRWILAFYEIPLFPGSCNPLYHNTHQIILNESTGIIDVYIYDKQICTGWNDGRAMIGLQNYDRDKGIMAPNRHASSPRWGSIGMNEAWRFTPKDGPSLFQRVELLDLSGNVVAVGDTSSFTPSVLSVNFPNVCPSTSTTYVIKSTYLKIDDPDTEVYGYDTVNVVKNSAIPNITIDTTMATCAGNGSITITAPLGPNYEYSIDNGANYGSATTFSVAAGHYTVLVREIGGTCVNSLDVDITSTSPLVASATSTNTACPGVNTGTIQVQVQQGAPGFTFLVDTMTVAQTDSLFTGLGEGTHVVTVLDNAGCSYIFNVNVGSDASFTTAASSINASCLGVSNGSINVNVPTGGTAPFEYSIPGVVNVAQPSPSFANLAGGITYIIKVVDANGCSYSFGQPVDNDPGVTATDSTVLSECTNAATGKIFVKPGTGVSPFQFSMDGGVTFQVPDSFLNLMPGVYPVRVSDNVGCYYDFNSTVGAGPGFTATDSVVITACNGASTGKIFVKPVGGIAPFTYSIDGGAPQAADSFINLGAATYSVTVADAVGCSYSFNATVGAGVGITATDSVVVTACLGAATGKIFVRPAAGMAPYTFSIDGGAPQAADSFTNLAAATYTIGVTDAVGCHYDFSSTVGAGTGVTATDSTVVSSCTTASTGKIFVKPGMGIAPFTYSKDGGTPQAADSFLLLAPGSYLIRVTDAAGCYLEFNSTVGAGPGFTATDSTVVSNCAAATTGKIFVKPVGGFAPFNYSIDGGAPQPADSFINLAPATYLINVTDAVGCSYSFNSTVGIGAGVSATDSVVVSACATAATGKIFVKPGLGVAPFRYSINGSLPQLADSFINLAPATYAIEVTDAVGCDYAFNSTVGAGPGVTASFSTINSACLGVSSGKIVITPSSGTAPFFYSMGGPVLPLDTIRGLASGTYSNIVLSDVIGCTYNMPVITVGDDPGVSAGFTIVNAACSGAATGAIIVKPVSGVPSFSYSLDGGVHNQPDSVFRNLLSNAYTITITDALGCKMQSPVQNVGNNVGVTVAPSTIGNSSCASIPNGSITVNVSTGIAPFTYTLTSVPGFAPQAGNSFGNLFSGNYDISIVDSAGCTKTITDVVGNNPKVKFDNLNISKPTCNGLLNGSIDVSVSLGVAPYEYALDGGTFSGAKTFTGVGAGAHVIHVRDANLCAIDSSINVAEPAVLTNSLLGTTPSTCSGNPDGQITVGAAGGTSPYQYTLDAAGASGFQASASLAVVAGNYTVTAQDANGCKATVNAVVDSVFTMYLDLGPDTTICAGQSMILRPNTNAGTTIFNYSPRSSLDKADIKNPTATPTDTTRYSVTATWGICSLSDNILVKVLRKPVADAGNDVVICYDTTTVLQASASNLSGTVNFAWTPASLIDGRADTTIVTARPDTFRTYYTVTVRDNYGCNFAVTDSVLVNMLPPVYAFAGNDTNAVLNAPHRLTASGAGIGGTYQWSYPAGVTLSTNGISNPMATFSPVQQPGTFAHPDTNYYDLSVIATNQAGCWATDTVRIHVFNGPTFYVPNAFSPNNDGFNDIFRPILVGINTTDYFVVYNRYGQVVFQTNRFMQGWDGKFKGVDQPAGNYVWILKGKGTNGLPVEMKGSVLLVR